MAPKTNGFMIFVHEWRRNNTGGRAMSLQEAIGSCDGIWQVMTTEERSPYIEEARIVNQRLRVQRIQRTVDPMDLVQREAEERLEKMKRATETIVLDAVETNGLENKNFFFVAFNYFTKSANSDLYIPAEFSACQFSLKQGIVSVYTTFINPGRIDLGQASDALHHSSTTHNLPLPPNALGERDVTKLYREIHEYILSSSDSEPIVVFTMREAMAKVKASLYDLKIKSCHQGQEIMVHDMEYLLFCLKKQALQIAGLPVDDITELGIEAYLRRDIFEYSNNIACEYHEYKDRSQFCTLTWIRTRAFAFCDTLCEDLHIPKIPDKHIPQVEIEPDPGNDNECSIEVKTHIPLAGFGRGRPRGRLPTLGEANH